MTASAPMPTSSIRPDRRPGHAGGGHVVRQILGATLIACGDHHDVGKRRSSVPLIAISPQAPDGSLSMQQKHDLAFAVLSDPGNRVAHGLGILTAPSDEARAAQLQLGLDLTTVNADGTLAVPMPTAAILDAGHTIRWIDVHRNYGTRTEPAEIVDALDRLA
jgi:peroxiredoxin